MPTPLQELKDRIGQSAYDQVMEVLGGETVYFPIHSSYMDKQQRNLALLNDFYAGADISTLSQKYHVSKSQVYKIVQRKVRTY